MRGEYGRPRVQVAGQDTPIGFSPIPGLHLPTVDDVRQQLEHGAAQLRQGIEHQVERTVKVRGAVLLVGAVSAIGLIIALSAMADP